MKQRGHILLKDKFIYFANDGLPFDREGVIAISKHNISSKGGNEEDKPIDLFKNIPDSKWIEAQHKHSIENYIREPNNIGADRKSETEAAKDYVGRWLFEVLQNMDDAIGPKDFKKFIGTKGLGFLSVLNVGHTPEIFSGEFSFKFSKTLTTEALLNSDSFDKNLEKYAKNPPMFQVFHPADKDEKIISFFKQGFKTVIKLEIFEEQKENIINDLKNIDHKFLIFSRNINKLTLKINDDYEKSFEKKSQNISHNKESSKDKISIKIYDNLIKNEFQEQWILWGRQWKSNSENNKLSSCMMALPFDGEKCFSLEYHSNFYNFFPTNNNSKTFALFHLTFQLSQDRNNLQMWGKEQKWESKNCNRENITLLDNLEKLLLKDFIEDPFVNPKLVLEVFQDLNNDEDVLGSSHNKLRGEVYKKLKIELISHINNSSFIPIYGGGTSRPSSLNLWERKLIDCFEADQEISKFNLPFKDINEFYKVLEKYNCSHILYHTFVDILIKANKKVANNGEREELLKLIYYYLKDVSYIFIRKIFSIELFEDLEGNIVSLNQGPYFKNSIKKIPSFINEKKLTTFSEKLISKYFLKDFSDDNFLKNLKDKFITNDNEIINSIPDIITHWSYNESINGTRHNSWPKYGYELLNYLIKYHVKNKRINFKNKLLDALYLPTDKKDDWQNCKKICLSKQWGASSGFINWFESNENKKFFKIKSKNSFLNELKKRESKKDQYEIRSKDVKSFLLCCGVRDYPQIKRANIHEVQSLEIYQKYKNHPNSIDIKYINEEYYYENIEDIFDGITFSDTIKMSLKMIEEANNFVSVYYRPHARNSQPRNNKYINLGLFQLANLKWFKYKPSIICANGLYSPMEIVITSQASNQILPIITKKDLTLNAKINNEQLNFLIENLNIRTNSEKLSKHQFLNFIKDKDSFECNFNKYLEDHGKDFAHAQLRVLLKNLSDLFPADPDEHDYIINKELKDISFPCHKIGSLDEKISWFQKNKVLFNDTNFNINQLRKLKFLSQFGIFFINQNNLNFQNLSNIIDYNINPKYIEKAKLEIFKEIIKSNWSRINFVQEVLKNPIKATFEEFQDRFLFCSNIKITVLNEDYQEEIGVDVWEEHRKFYVKLDLNDDIDEDLKLFYSHICKLLFKNGSSYSLVKDVLNCNSEFDLKQTFEANGIDPLQFKDYKNLHYENDISLRNKEFLNEKNQITKNKEKLKNNLINHNKTSEIQLTNQNKINENKKIKKTTQSENEKVPSNSVSTQPQNIHKKNKNISPKTFGKRLSGHFRPVNPRGIVVRNFFDDEISSNKAIGIEGENYVLNILKSQGYEGVNLLGGNNKGYDIEYIDGDQIHFIEVKSLKGLWKDSDVLLSKAQFEKAQIEKDKYTICVVENLDSEEEINVFSINNPADYFTKMQIDHGWKDFAAQIDKIPEKGNFIEIKGEILEILKVTKIAKKNYRLELNNNRFEFYKPDEMILKSKKDVD